MNESKDEKPGPSSNLATSGLSFWARWFVIILLVGLLCGLSSAGFLWGLEWVTVQFQRIPQLLDLLPVAGVLTSWLYYQYGRDCGAGTNLLLEAIQHPERKVSLHLAPLVVVTTLLTHLCGGSAGREGTAVQMGGALAVALEPRFRLTPDEKRVLVLVGIAGGFGSVFGTPAAGAVFGLEILSLGRLRYVAIIPCFLASYLADFVCRSSGIEHTEYALGRIPTLTLPIIPWLILAATVFAVAAFLFIESLELTQKLFLAVKDRGIRGPIVGGILIVMLTQLVGTTDYNGIGTALLQKVFSSEVPINAWFLKLLFTVITLGAGFKGGEVTPLFCIGAALGFSFAQLTGQPLLLFAALGFCAVFCGAANTPLTGLVLGIEFFGWGIAPHLAIVCSLMFLVNGHRSIYKSQLASHPEDHLYLGNESSYRRKATVIFKK